MTDPHDRETYTQSLEARCDALVAELARYDQKDRAKTREINILVPEIRALAAQLKEARTALYETREPLDYLASMLKCVGGVGDEDHATQCEKCDVRRVLRIVDAALLKEPTT